MITKNKYYTRWKKDYDFKTLLSAGISLLVTSAFALYNGYLGIRYSSLWHGTICVYYILLVVLRGMIILTEKKYSGRDNRNVISKRVYLAEAVFLFILNLSLIIPVAIMVMQNRPINLTLVPAIMMATYTTYKIIMASVNLKRRKRASGRLIRLLRTISFIDALVSILTLQNTLIMVVSGGSKNGMLTLTAFTSGAIWLAILLLSVSVLVTGIRAIKQKD